MKTTPSLSFNLTVVLTPKPSASLSLLSKLASQASLHWFCSLVSPLPLCHSSILTHVLIPLCSFSFFVLLLLCLSSIYMHKHHLVDWSIDLWVSMSETKITNQKSTFASDLISEINFRKPQDDRSGLP